VFNTFARGKRDDFIFLGILHIRGIGLCTPMGSYVRAFRQGQFYCIHQQVRYLQRIFGGAE
jgi:hypothetical protein